MGQRKISLIWVFAVVAAVFFIAAGISSCCQPAHKNSNPVVIDSLFQETYGRDADEYQVLESGSNVTDSAWYPIYTFGIANTGTADDDFTLQIRYINNTVSGNPQTGGFDITRHVPAGDTVLFRTPVGVPDSITKYETFFYPVLPATDTTPNVDFAYFYLSFQSSDSAEIHFMRPSIDILSGVINNGPEACNTPASQMNVDPNSLPYR
jgi:hypothetical protein